MTNETRTTCTCEPFQKAQETCTDNEGYGRLISRSSYGWVTGCDLPPIKFCPWCGNELPDGTLN